MKQHLFGILVAAGLVGLSVVGCVDDSTQTTDQFGPDESDEVVAPEAQPEAEAEAPQPPPAPPTCVTIKRGVLGDVKDTFIPGDYYNYAPGNEVNMYSGVSAGGNINRVLVNFDLSSIPQYATISSATFHIYKSWSADNATVNLYRVTSDWQEATASLSTPLTFDPVAVGSFSGGDVGFKSVDLKNVVQGWKNGSPQRGIVLDEQPIQSHHYFSSESGSLAPSLDVCYSAATCNDGVQNQGESGVDCGGPCASCVSCSDGVQNQGEQGVDCGGPCNPCGNLCHPIGYNSCPSGATQFCSNQAISGTNAAQAKAACEACYGHTCYLSNADCAGPGYGPNPSYSCGDPYWGYSSGCSGTSGRVWYICSSYTTYGYWAN